jgi:hypothetical protein
VFTDGRSARLTLAFRSVAQRTKASIEAEGVIRLAGRPSTLRSEPLVKRCANRRGKLGGQEWLAQ